jgi:ABC-type amino acid transport substrate-binding protein
MWAAAVARSLEVLKRLAAACSLAVCFAGASAQSVPLKVCISEENAPLSLKVKGQPATQNMQGLDVRVAQAIATELGRELKLVPFESKYEQETSLAHEVNAMLSSGVCELASGYVLLKSELGAPTRPTARVPDHPGAPRPPLRKWIPLNTLAGSAAYHSAALGVVVREPGKPVARLSDLVGMKVGAVAGTFEGTALNLYRSGLLKAHIVSVSRDKEVLDLLEAGSLDATLVPVDRFDAWRANNPKHQLRRESYVHPMRINIGFVALADATDVLAATNKVITTARVSGELQRWTADAGATWIEPGTPNVGEPMGMADLLRE